MTGVYRIKNKINGKCYYGSSKNIEKRWRHHKSRLNKKTHINCILQNAWNKYGEENFLFEVVEECKQEELFIVEQKYLDLLPEYNIGVSASGGDNISKNPKREDIIKNIKKGLDSRMKELSPEERKKAFSKPLSKNPNWKGGSSFFYCECGKRIGYGNKNCIKCKPKDGQDNPFFGKKHSKETKDKLRENKKGVYKGSQNNPIIVDNTEYQSAGEASKILGIPMTTIRWRVLSKNPKYKNYQLKCGDNSFYSEEEQSERLAKSQRNKKRNFNKPFNIDGIEYRSLKEASELLGIHPMTIKSRLVSKNFPNYKYKHL